MYSLPSKTINAYFFNFKCVLNRLILLELIKLMDQRKDSIVSQNKMLIIVHINEFACKFFFVLTAYRSTFMHSYPVQL